MLTLRPIECDLPRARQSTFIRRDVRPELGQLQESCTRYRGAAFVAATVVSQPLKGKSTACTVLPANSERRLLLDQLGNLHLLTITDCSVAKLTVSHIQHGLAGSKSAEVLCDFREDLVAVVGGRATDVRGQRNPGMPPEFALFG